jgi:urease accessory protein
MGIHRCLDATLHLRFHAPNQGRPSALSLPVQQPPLRAIRAFDVDGCMALVHLHNLSGGILGGDQLTLVIQVDAGAAAQVTSTGATRVYRRRPGLRAASQTTYITVGEAGLLEYLPDLLIPYAQAQYHQTTQIVLEQDAGLFYWDVIAPGRQAHGETFAYDWLRLDLDIIAAGLPVLSERALLEPAFRPLTSPARLGPYGYFGAFYICRAGVEPATWLCLEEELAALAECRTAYDQAIWGVSALAAHGLVVRAVATTARRITSTLPDFWRTAKRRLYQTEPILPRKVY